MHTVTITAQGTTETIKSAHALLIAESIINGHDAYGDVVTCKTGNLFGSTWEIESNNGLIVVTIGRA